MSKAKGPPTMADIAALVGVSTMTVSRALRSDSSVKPVTRDRIRQAADNLGYVLDSTAAVLSSGKTGFVAVTIPSINNGNFADTVSGMTTRLEEAGLQILLGSTEYDVTREEDLVEQFLRRRPEAIVVTGGTHTERCRRILENAGVPVIEIWDRPDNPIGNVVGFSNAEAGRLMVGHFCDQSYKRIGFIGGDLSSDTRGLDRRRGFAEELAARGLGTDRLLAFGMPPVSMKDGAEGIRQLLDTWPDTQAVMCVSDISAFGALMECERMGVSVPGEIAIAGFGAYDLAEQAVPAITTIDVSARAIGSSAAQTIIRLLADDGEAEAVGIDFQPVLILRASTIRIG